MKRREKVVTTAALRKKLLSAAAMLLVASIMLVSTSYAWLVLSAAPEVTGISTSVGGNGSLEIALLNTETYDDPTLITSAVGDSMSNEMQSVKDANITWGNLISLSDVSYGLNKISLNPSRLYIEKEGEDYVVRPTLLKTPIYDETGRIVGISKDAAMTAVYDSEKDEFPIDIGNNYGVRAVGVASNMTAEQEAVNAARAAVNTAMSDARKNARTSLSEAGSALGNIAVGIALKKGAATFTVTDIEALRDLAIDIQVSLEHIDYGIRQMYLGYVGTTLTGEELNVAREAILAESTTLSSLKSTYPTVPVPNARAEVGGDIIALLESDQAAVKTAIEACNTKIAENKAAYEQGDITKLMGPLVQYEQMTLNNYTLAELRDMNEDQLMAIVINSGDMSVVVPTGSGILSDIADFAEDYTTEVVVENVSYGGISVSEVPVTMRTESEVNPAYLAECNRFMLNFDTEGGSGTNISDYYGYVLDFAVRTNAADSYLQLQTESVNRMSGEAATDGEASSELQGGGSYMEFAFNGDVLSASKMLKLMSGLRVVFMDEDGKVLGIAALDMTMGKDAYLAAPYVVKGKVAIDDAEIEISENTCGDYSEWLTADEYNALGETTEADTETSTYVLGRDAYESALVYIAKETVSIDGSDIPVSGSTCSNYVKTLTANEYVALKDSTVKDEGGETYTLGKDAYEEFSSQYVLALPVGTEAQRSDYITALEYLSLSENHVFTIDPTTGAIKAPLYLYNFEMTLSDTSTEEDVKYTGGITLGEKLDSSAIMALEENVATKISTLVYLDGSIVNNSMVAANSTQSMTGTMNLQFSSSANLMPMNNQALFDGEDAAAPPESGSGENDSESGSGSDPAGDQTT